MDANRGRPPSPRDRVHLTSQERQAAVQAAADKKPEYDDHKLLKLLRSAKSELAGLRLIHFHLSLLRDKDSGNQLLVRTLMGEMTSAASYLQAFVISNGDVIVLYKGLKLSSITEVCQKIESLFLARTTMTDANPYKEFALYSIMELSLNFIIVMRVLEELHRGEPEVVPQETKPPITLEEMGKLERVMQMFDLSPFLFNQAIVDLGAHATDMEKQYEYFELYISIRLLQERLCPDYDITANRWLFNYFTTNLDQSVLRALSHGISFMRGRQIGLNINLATVISTGFIKFDERLPIDYRGNVVLEIAKSDLIENLRLFEEVSEFARERKYKICVDGLNPFWITNFDLEGLNVDFAKIFWQGDMLDMDEDFRHQFLEKVKTQRRCQFVLARCDTVSSLLFAREAGIHLVQGRAVDNILRKGVTVREAIGAAEEIHRE